MDLIALIIAISIAYLFGSLSSAIIVCKLMKLPDPRTQGSKNPGATNVLRLGGKKAAAVTLLGDVMKGVIPILLAQWYGFSAIGLALVASAAFLGHLFPIFFRFEGGKGVATLIGCLFALSLPVGLSWVITWLFVTLLFRYSSLSSLIASLLAPVYLWFFTNNLSYVSIITLMSLLLIYRHRSNIEKLLAGKENKLGKKKI